MRGAAMTPRERANKFEERYRGKDGAWGNLSAEAIEETIEEAVEEERKECAKSCAELLRLEAQLVVVAGQSFEVKPTADEVRRLVHETPSFVLGHMTVEDISRAVLKMRESDDAVGEGREGGV